VTPDSDVDDVPVPDDLAGALRRAAAAVPAADLHPSEPKLRHAIRRRRRRTVGACFASAAVLAVAVVAAQLVDRPSLRSDVAVADRSPTEDGDGDGPGGPGGPDREPRLPVLLPFVHAELEPDGTTRRLPLARENDLPDGGAARLPDGRLATLASRDLRPGSPRVDGAMVEDLAYVLAVFDPDGRLLAEQDVRRVGERVSIAGVHDGRVVLVRHTADGNCCGSLPGVRVSTIDPDSFVETPVTEIDRLPGVAAVSGDRLVLVDDGTTGAIDAPDAPVPACRITAIDLVTGTSGEVTTLPCLGVQGVSVSPDGTRAAVVMQRRAGISASGNSLEVGRDVLDQAVVFVSLDDGEVLGSERFDLAPPCPMEDGLDCELQGPVEYRGLAWVDDDHVELVVQDPAPATGDVRDRVIDVGLLVPERIRTIPVEVGAG